MSATDPAGWKIFMQGRPWFSGKGRFPLPAYSEFMPPPRLGRRPYGEADIELFLDHDPFGWQITEIEEEYELRPGLKHLADQIMGSLLRLGQGKPEYHIAGHRGRNLTDNPFWPSELQDHAGKLAHERYVVFLPLALSRTQDDKGRVRWTFFGSSEQGPEQAFWKGFYSAPETERPERESLAFIRQILSSAYYEAVGEQAGLLASGFRVLPAESNPRFPYWTKQPLPSWTRPFVVTDSAPFENIRYLLTFRPFSRLPELAKARYLSGKLVLLPFPGSLLFWGQQHYIRLQAQLPMAMQMPLLRLVARHGAPGGIRVPQSGWFHEPGSREKPSEVSRELLVNTFRRTSRWDRVHRHQDDLALSVLEDKVARVLFSTEPDALGLYSKPMARNSQIWTEDSRLLLDGPNATPGEIALAAAEIAEGGHFRYRFQFPAMRVGKHEVYWHRPLVAYWSAEKERIEVLPDVLLGCMTAYEEESSNLGAPVLLWPRLLRREVQLAAIQNFDHLSEHYAHQTPLNILALVDCFRLRGERRLPRTFAWHLLRIAEHDNLDTWLSSLAERGHDLTRGKLIVQVLERMIESCGPPGLPEAMTCGETTLRSFEEGLWNDMLTLSHGQYLNKDNADCVQDPKTLSRLQHHQRDLEALGEYLLGRHRQAIAEAGMGGKAVCGEIPFHWKTDFDYSLFGGWKNNQEGHTHERNIMVVIPGKNRSEAVILADHYDTAYMEDLYYKSSGGEGVRIAAPGADDNHSATATLLRAAPLFLKMAREGHLERDVWLLHLTGEEFPADCLGARHFCEALVEKTLHLRLSKDESIDLSSVCVVGLYVMDMIAHNRESEKDVFQISPGKGAKSLELARQAHMANQVWNAVAEERNRSGDRRGLDRGKRSADGIRIPDPATHLVLSGEVRTADDPRSSLYNTDGQIFSDVGVPVVLFMENYDIDRKGYHDTHDTMENIDLDYGAAVAAIAIEAAARTANKKV